MRAAWLPARLRTEAGRRFSHLLALAGTFALLGALGAGARLAAQLREAVVTVAEQNVHVIVYLDDAAGGAEADRLTALLRQMPSVRRVTMVAPDEALGRLRAAAASLAPGPQLDDVSAALATIEPGFLPRSLEIALAPGPDLARGATELAARLRGLPSVIAVDAMTEGVARLTSWLTLGRWTAIMALLLGGLAVVAALVLLVARGRAAGRSSVEVLHFLGETPAGIRLPVVVTFAGAAVLGTAVGLLALALALPRVWASLGAVIGLESRAGFLAPLEIGAAVAAAALLGGLLGRAATPVPEGESA